MVAHAKLNIVRWSQNASMFKSTTMLRGCARIAIIPRAVTRWLIDVTIMIESSMLVASVKPAIYVTITVGWELQFLIRILKGLKVERLVKSNLIILQKLMLQAINAKKLVDNNKFSSSNSSRLLVLMLPLHLKIIIDKYSSWPRIMGNQPKKINKINNKMAELNQYLPHRSHKLFNQPSHQSLQAKQPQIEKIISDQKNPRRDNKTVIHKHFNITQQKAKTYYDERVYKV